MPVPAAFSAAVVVLAQGRHVGVVACLVRQTGESAQGFVEVEHAPVQIDAAVHVPVVVHRAGDADPEADHVFFGQTATGQGFVNGPGDVGENGRAPALRPGGDLPFFQEAAFPGKQTELDRGAAHVHTECTFHSDAAFPNQISFLPIISRLRAFCNIT